MPDTQRIRRVRGWWSRAFAQNVSFFFLFSAKSCAYWTTRRRTATIAEFRDEDGRARRLFFCDVARAGACNARLRQSRSSANLHEQQKSHSKSLSVGRKENANAIVFHVMQLMRGAAVR